MRTARDRKQVADAGAAAPGEPDQTDQLEAPEEADEAEEAEEAEAESSEEEGTEYVGILEGGWDHLPPEIVELLRYWRESCDDPAISLCPPLPGYDPKRDPAVDPEDEIDHDADEKPTPTTPRTPSPRGSQNES